MDGFRTFGYLVLRGFLPPAVVDALRVEVVRTLIGVHGDRYHERPAMSGMAGHYACMLGPWAPVTVDLVEDRRLVGLAERLVGGGVLPSPCDTQAILYFDNAGWHTDTGIAIRAVKFVAYLDPLDAGTGALRVLPASHRLPGALDKVHALDLDVPDVPGVALPTEPGDVIAFDPWLFHATAGGRDRLQWSTMYLRDAVTPSWRAGLIAWYEDGAADVDVLPEGWRPFDPIWVAEGSGDAVEPGTSRLRRGQRHVWMYRLNRLGILDRFGVAGAYRP